MTSVISTIVGAVTSFLQGVGAGVGDFFDSLMLDGTALSNLGIFILTILGLTIGLAVVRGVWSLIGGYRTRA